MDVINERDVSKIVRDLWIACSSSFKITFDQVSIESSLIHFEIFSEFF